MALTAAALETYSQGRLDRDDPETTRQLAAALSAAQRWCGWHVTPVAVDQVVTLDGPGGLLLRLPSLRVLELTKVIEDGVELDVDGLELSRIGLVRKKSGGVWTTRLGGIEVTMSHGFADAPDFESAVLAYADRASQAPAGGLPVAVGPFRWGDSSGGGFSSVELSILEQYRLECAP
jgi:hypothetical protein